MKNHCNYNSDLGFLGFLWFSISLFVLIIHKGNHLGDLPPSPPEAPRRAPPPRGAPRRAVIELQFPRTDRNATTRHFCGSQQEGIGKHSSMLDSGVHNVVKQLSVTWAVETKLIKLGLPDIPLYIWHYIYSIYTRAPWICRTGYTHIDSKIYTCVHTQQNIYYIYT